MGPSATANPTLNYVTLGIGDEIFAVDVAIVREILAYRTVAHLPNAPPFPTLAPIFPDKATGDPRWVEAIALWHPLVAPRITSTQWRLIAGAMDAHAISQ